MDSSLVMFKKPRRSEVRGLCGKIVSSLAKRYNNPYLNLDDAYQVAWQAVYKSLKTYNGTSSFTSWAYASVRHALAVAYLKNKHPVGMSKTWIYLKDKAGDIQPAVPMDVSIHDQPITQPIESGPDDNQLAVSAFLAKIQKKYPKQVCNVIADYYILGHSPSRLRKKYGCWQSILQSVSQDLQVVFAEVKQDLLN